MTSGRIPGEQRLFSLLLALIATPQGATKRELLSSVYGYADRYAREAGFAGATPLPVDHDLWRFYELML